MTSYSRIYYEAYEVATGEPVTRPDGACIGPVAYDEAAHEAFLEETYRLQEISDVGFATSDALALAIAERKCGVRFHHAERLTRPAKPDLHNEIAEEGCDRCTCGCKYWEHDRCIDCGTHVSHVRAAEA